MTSDRHWSLPRDREELLRSLDSQDWVASLSKDEREIAWQAYILAKEAHKAQTRESGEPYILHPLSVAKILVKYRLDAEAVAAALLHDVVEDTSVPLNVIEQRFGSQVAALVDGVSKLKRYSQQQQDAESLRKLVLAMISDVRVVLIKLADRLHNVRTLAALPEDRKREIARETLDIYSPLAERLGIWEIRAELEDLSFRYLSPDAYAQIAAEIQRSQQEHEEILDRIIKRVRVRLLEAHLPVNEFTITGRPKHIYSIYKKMHTPKYDGKGIERIYDKLGIRIIVNTVPECYTVLGIVHSEWPPIPGEFDDYIGMRLPSGYRSLHTAVRYGPREHDVVEFQIRTREMHYEAEYGVAAHWLYKEKSKPDRDIALQKKVAWLRQMIEGPQESEDAEAFVEALKSEVFQDRVYVFTPKWDIIDLPHGATPIDFAYYIHTEIGHRCRGAKVNGRMVTLNTELKNADRVEIITTKQGGPSRDWLNPAVGYVRTSRARSKIRHWFRKRERAENIAHGREVLEKELRKLGLSKKPYEQVARLFRFDEVDDFLTAIGSGDINAQQITTRILEAEQEEEEEFTITGTPPPPTKPAGVSIQGVDDLLTRVPGCCNPLPGDNVIGYITRGHGVTLHKDDCPNARRMIAEDPDRIIDVDWREDPGRVYPVAIRVLAYDRRGLMRDVTDVVASEDVNISAAAVQTNKKKNIAEITATLEIRSVGQLATILNKIGRVPNVFEVRREVG